MSDIPTRNLAERVVEIYYPQTRIYVSNDGIERELRQISMKETGQRYIQHREHGTSVHLFFRESKEADGDLGAPAYLYAGPASYVSHSGDRPMRIIWKLEHELPADVFHSARVAAG